MNDSKDLGASFGPGSREPGPKEVPAASGFDPSRIKYKRSVYFFGGPGITQSIVLPDGFRFLILTKGHSPSVAPITEPGRYEISPELLPNGEWPICVTTCDAADAEAMERIPADRTSDMIAAIAAYYRDSDGSGEAGQTAQQAGPVGRERGPGGHRHD